MPGLLCKQYDLPTYNIYTLDLEYFSVQISYSCLNKNKRRQKCLLYNLCYICQYCLLYEIDPVIYNMPYENRLK